jgi:hypothetical protein
LQIGPFDEAATHRVWVAAEAIFDGVGEEADPLLAGLSPDDVSSHLGAQITFLRAIREIERAEPSERSATFVAARKNLKSPIGVSGKNKSARRTHRRGIRRVAVLVGPRAWLWAALRYTLS